MAAERRSVESVVIYRLVHSLYVITEVNVSTIRYVREFVLDTPAVVGLK